MKSLNPILLLSVSLLVITGCSTVYKPQPGTPSLKDLGSFPTVNEGVALVNAQPSTDKVLVFKGGGFSEYADLNVWTAQLNQSLRDTLKKKKVKIDDHGSKVLKLAIRKASIEMRAGGFNPRCTLDWTVELGDGTPIALTVETGHWKYQDASNVAVRLACLKTLQDERVQRYLGQ